MRTIPARLVIGALLALLILGGGAFAVWKAQPGPGAPSRTDGIAAYRAGTEQAIRRMGPQKAYAAFKEAHAGEEFSAQHNGAHLFGEMLYDTVGLKGVGTCDADLNYGCFHGFLTEAIAKEGLTSITGLDAACAATATPASCQHGLGHGILEYLGHTKVVEALDACRSTHQQPDPIAGCASGVFMEYNVPIVFDEQGMAHLEARRITDPSKPYDLCPTLPAAYQTVCYYSLPQWWMQVYGNDFVRMGKYCAEAPEAQRIPCVNGIGSIAASASGFDAEKAIRLCVLPDAALQGRCLAATAGSFLSNVNDRASAERVCAAAPAEFQSNCLP